MNKPVEKYISELLFKHDCVIVPNFGGFVGNHQSAKLNSQTNVLYPPTKQILFNRDLITNDGLLVSYIANQESVSLEEAKEAVVEFVFNSNDKLETTQIESSIYNKEKNLKIDLNEDEFIKSIFSMIIPENF